MAITPENWPEYNDADGVNKLSLRANSQNGLHNGTFQFFLRRQGAFYQNGAGHRLRAERC
ncbi:hypothetical protein GCM10011513_25490 [Franconibacter daqui]|nr:hypothetical protein GCM10011513_25490 [Franconibacter daqui]